jgi:hypothetical protein
MSSVIQTEVASNQSSRQAVVSKVHVNYIVSPAYDWIFFLLPPVLALVLGIYLSDSWLTAADLVTQKTPPAVLFIGMFINAHLVIVVFRSHVNQNIFKLYPARFVLIPLLLFASMLISAWFMIFIVVLAIFWDVYHSGMQTFGFGRIYDMKAGNDSLTGRKLDLWLNQLLYAGPILAGATMLDHFSYFEEFEYANLEDLLSQFFSVVPAFMETNQRYFAWAVIGFGTLFIFYYVFANYRWYKQGRNVSLHKVFLYASTGVTSIYTWGFDSWGEAFFIMNFFHAFQYFGIVWVAEKKNILRMFRVDKLKAGKAIALTLFVGLSFAYGYAVFTIDRSIMWIFCLSLVVSIMHFWYDGFIWSVHKKQI